MWKRSAHLTKGLELLKTLPDTPERAQQELTLQIALGAAADGHQGLCGPRSGTSLHPGAGAVPAGGRNSSALPGAVGTVAFYLVRAELQTARELAEQLLQPGPERTRPGSPCWRPTMRWGMTLFWLGRVCLWPEHTWSRALPSTIPSSTAPMPSSMGMTPGWLASAYAAWALWFLGYPDQALKRSHEALTLAQELSHPFSLAYALDFAAWLHQLRREGQAAQERAEAAD